MANPLRQQIEQISREKNINPDIVIAAIEDAILTASKKYYKNDEDLRSRFQSAVHQTLARDDFQNKSWCERMLSTLFLEGNEAQTEQILSGLSPEFFMHIEWLPGGRFEDGEFIPDTVFEEAAAHPENAALCKLCDPRAMGVIFNLIREFGDVEYINVARLPESQFGININAAPFAEAVWLTGDATHAARLRAFLANPAD